MDPFAHRVLNGLFVENSVQQRTMDFYFSVVADEAEFPELVHEKADPRSCRADHFSQSLLTNVRADRGRITFLAEVRQQ